MSAVRPFASPTKHPVSLNGKDQPLSVLIGLEGLALGGCPINALDLARALRSRGHHVSVFAIDEDVKVSLLPLAQKCGFAPIVLPRSAGILRRSRQIRALSVEVGADVVHVFGPWLGPAASVAASTRRRQAAVVTNWTMSNVYFTPRHTPTIVGTRDLAEDLRARHSGPVWLMEPPVDVEADAPDPGRGHEFRREIGLAIEDVVAVVVGRVDSHMKAASLRHAMDAVGRLARPDLRLVIVGDGDAFDVLSNRAAEVNDELGRRAVIMTGARLDPRPAYDAADIALGMGGSALRALAHGKPLVVLGEKGFARVFDETSADYFYSRGFFGDEPEPDPVGHLAGLIAGLVGETDREQLATFGIDEIRSRFGLDTMATTLETIYRHSLRTLPGAGARRFNAGYVLTRTVAHQSKRAIMAHV